MCRGVYLRWTYQSFFYCTLQTFHSINQTLSKTLTLEQTQIEPLAMGPAVAGQYILHAAAALKSLARARHWGNLVHAAIGAVSQARGPSAGIDMSRLLQFKRLHLEAQLSLT